MPYTGGKGRAFQQLISLMPPHDTYIETHLGGGALLLRKRPAQRSIGIDRDPTVIARWRALSLAGLELIQGDAVDFLNELRMGPETLVFCDPPYWPDARRRGRCYRHDYSREDHHRLLRIIRTLRCHVMITGYQNTVYDEALAGWHLTEIRNVTQVGAVVEMAWTSYPPPLVLHDYDHIGSDFRDREALRRRRRSHVKRLKRASALERNAILADLADTFPDEMRAAVSRQSLNIHEKKKPRP